MAIHVILGTYFCDYKPNTTSLVGGCPIGKALRYIWNPYYECTSTYRYVSHGRCIAHPLRFIRTPFILNARRPAETLCCWALFTFPPCSSFVQLLNFGALKALSWRGLNLGISSRSSPARLLLCERVARNIFLIKSLSIKRSNFLKSFLSWKLHWRSHLIESLIESFY